VTIGNRVPADVELQGLDLPEMGALGYPDFVLSPESEGTSVPEKVGTPATRPVLQPLHENG
jgi:Amt family ammonium transporter